MSLYKPVCFAVMRFAIVLSDCVSYKLSLTCVSSDAGVTVTITHVCAMLISVPVLRHTGHNKFRDDIYVECRLQWLCYIAEFASRRCSDIWSNRYS